MRRTDFSSTAGYWTESDHKARCLMGMVNCSKGIRPGCTDAIPMMASRSVGSRMETGRLGSDRVPGTEHVQSSPASGEMVGVPDTGIGRIANLGPLLNSHHPQAMAQPLAQPLENAGMGEEESPIPNAGFNKPVGDSAPGQKPSRTKTDWLPDIGMISHSFTIRPDRLSSSLFPTRATWRNSAANPNTREGHVRHA